MKSTDNIDPPTTLEKTDADLCCLPESTPVTGSEVTVGDLHGNAIKLVYFLIKTGIFETTDENYKALIQSYHQLEAMFL